MRLELTEGELTLQLRHRFALAEANRVHEAVAALAPLSRLTVDFLDIRESEDRAFARLAETLLDLRPVDVALRGLTLRQAHVLDRLLARAGRGGGGAGEARS